MFETPLILVLVPNFLHHFDPPTCVKFLRKLRAAMKPRAALAIVEFVPNEDRISPPMAAAFSLQMLGGTEAGDAYTFREFSGMVTEAGFTDSQQQLGQCPYRRRYRQWFGRR